MDDNNDNDNNEENIKSKNIRRLLLLKTDKELKTKKKANFRINTKTIQELNKSYDLYNMLLSERTTIYFNYVKTEERIYPNNIKPINIRKMVSTHKKVEKPVKILNITTTIEEDDCSNSPINFFPQKIDFGLKRINAPRRRSKNFTKLPKLFDNLYSDNSSRIREEVNRSTEVAKRGLYKLVDKIINIKMSEDIEDIVKKNIIKLRKYCNKLKKTKRKVKKINKIKPISPRKSREQNERNNNIKRKKNSKRMTINDNKNFFKKSLFGSRGENLDYLKKRSGVRMKTTKNLQLKIIGNSEQNQKEIHKEHFKLNYAKTMRSSEIEKKNKSPKKTEYSKPQKKMRIRKMQSLNNMKNILLENKGLKLYKKTDSNQEESFVSPFNALLSDYNNRPMKTLKNSKFKPLFDKNTSRNINNNINRGQKSIIQSNINSTEKKNNNFRRSMKKSKKLSIRLYDKWIDLN